MDEMKEINQTLANDPYILNTAQKEEALVQVYKTLRSTISILNGSVVEPGGEQAAEEVSKELQLALFHVDHLLNDYPSALEILSGEVLHQQRSISTTPTVSSEDIPF